MKGVAPFSEPVDGAKPAPSSNPFALLGFALANYPGMIQIVNFAGAVKNVRIVKRSGEASAILRVEAPPGVGLNLQAPPGEQDAYLLIHVERSVLDAMDEPPPLIVLPPGIVSPR